MPAVLNWLEESTRSEGEIAGMRNAFFAAPPHAKTGGGELPFLVADTLRGYEHDSNIVDVLDQLVEAVRQLKLVTVVAVLIIAAFSCLLNPTIGCLSTFFFL